MDYISVSKNGQEGIIAVEELLSDERFAWRWRKVRTMRLAELYKLAGMDDYARRALSCATWLQYNVGQDGKKQLSAANFCQLRLCPMCTARRARKSAYRLSRVLDLVELQHGAKFIFFTLTIRNVPGSDLGDALTLMTRAWDKFCRQRPIRRAFRGWFRALEITRGDGKRKEDKGYHPHIHVIAAVEPEYFRRKSGLYITHEDLLYRWRQVLDADYLPSVHIRTTRARGAKAASRSAAAEANKYSIKDDEYIDPALTDEQAVEILTDYTCALHGRRLTAMGGWLREAAKALDMDELEDDDLVRIDDETTLREDVVELIETYNWNFGAGDYILSSRRKV